MTSFRETKAPEPTGNDADIAVELESFEMLFRQESRELLTNRLRVGLAVGSFLFVAFAGLDFFVVGELFKTFFLIRLLTVLLPLIAIPLSYSAWGQKHIQPISILIMFIGATSIAVMTRILGGFGSEYYIGIMLAAFLVGLFFPWGVRATVGYCFSVMLTYLGLNLGTTGVNGLADALLPVFFLGGTFILTCCAAGAIEKTRRSGLSMRLQLKEANESLQELDKAKSSFFANVSHELRTPLALILSPLDQMMRGEAGDPAPLLESMNANAHRLLRQVNTILNFSKIEAGQQDCNRELGQVAEVLETLVTGAAPYAAQRGITLTGIGFDTLPEILHDAEQVETSVANLLSNAMKFTSDGGEITLSAGAENDFLWIEVTDTGCGIPKKDVRKVFERFHQVDGGKGGKIQGTGLGLALSKELVELHGGEMSAASVLGKGTTFRIQLPTLQASDWEGSAAQDPTTEKKEVQSSARNNTDTINFADVQLSSMEDTQDRILTTAGEDAPLLLVVEDNPDMRAFVSQCLSKNYRVATAENGKLGLETARKFRPDIIVSDVQMPVMDGFEMVAELRKDKAFDKTPIIMLTAKTGAEAVVKGLNLGAVDYVNKPFKMVEIEARIAAQLRMRAIEKTLDERDSRLVALGQMTGTIAHDMRSPLTAILNRIELVRMVTKIAGKLTGVDDELVAIEDTVHRVNKMMKELLEFVQGSDVTLDLRPIALSKFMGPLCEDIETSLKNADIVFDHKKIGDMETEILVDHNRIARVLENLVNNSRDAVTGVDGKTDGCVSMRTEVTKQQLIIRLADNGPGIPDEVAKKLHQPFATAGKASGTGLGLSIVWNLVTAHDGQIEVDHHPPEGGAAFTVTLPLRKSIGGSRDQKNDSDEAA
ncbi:MAG: signal transduction histidine kinase [Planctomycetota bacterium]